MQSCVGGNETVYAHPHRHLSRSDNLVIAVVGREFQQQWLSPALPV
jgi:hypothetical protein